MLTLAFSQENMPSGRELIQLMDYFTLAYKSLQAYSNLVTMLLWMSVSELLLTAALFISFCGAPERMGIIFM